MARGINRVIIVGNCGQDPETKYMPSGGAVTNISVATSEQWKDKQTGQSQDRVEWHKIVFFNRLAEIAGEYLRKGSQVYIEGSLRTRKWQSQDGQDRYTTEIVASEMQMLGSKPEGSAPQQNYGHQQPAQGSAQNPSRPAPPPNQPQGTHQRQAPQQQAPNYGQDPGFDAFDDDIPLDLAYRGMELAV